MQRLGLFVVRLFDLVGVRVRLDPQDVVQLRLLHAVQLCGTAARRGRAGAPGLIVRPPVLSVWGATAPPLWSLQGCPWGTRVFAVSMKDGPAVIGGGIRLMDGG